MDYRRAKEIFFKYGGMGYGMFLDGVIKEYVNFDVPKELEIEWQYEIMDELKKKMKLNPPSIEKGLIIHSYLMKNIEFYRKDSIDFLKDNKEKIQEMDDFSKLLMIEEVFRRSLPKEDERKKRVIEECIKELRRMLEKDAKKEFTIDEGHYEQGKIPDYLSGNKIKERIKSELYEQVFKIFDSVSDFEKILFIEELYSYIPVKPERVEYRQEYIEKCIKELRKLQKKHFIIDEKYYVNGILPDDLSSKELKKRIKNVLHKYQLAKKEL